MRKWWNPLLTKGPCLWGLIAVLSLFHSWGLFGARPTSGVGTLSVACAQEKATGGSITKLKIEPLYRAVRLTWKAEINRRGPVTFEIYRSQTKPDGPYTLVASIEWRPEMRKYKYVDKNLPVEENYFYKIEIAATKETFGPLQVRPPFSLPTT
jgi:hypothetical protein